MMVNVMYLNINLQFKILLEKNNQVLLVLLRGISKASMERIHRLYKNNYFQKISSHVLKRYSVKLLKLASQLSTFTIHQKCVLYDLKFSKTKVICCLRKEICGGVALLSSIEQIIDFVTSDIQAVPNTGGLGELTSRTQREGW